jgi:hypothetical protein
VVGPSDIIYGILLPALIAGVLLLLAGRGTSLAGKPRPFVGALAIGIGYLVCHVTRVGMPPVPFGSTQVPSRDWIAWLVLGAIVLAPIRLVPSLQRWSGPLYMALFSVLVFRLVLGNAIGSDAQSMLVRFALTFALYVGWNVLERFALRSTGPAAPLGWIVAGCGVAGCAFLQQNELLAQLCGSVCAGLGAAVLLSTMDKGAYLPTGAVAIGLIVFASTIVITGIYDLPRASIVLLGVSLIAPCVSQVGKLATLTPMKRAFVAAVAAGIPAAIAVAVTYAARAPTDG